MGFKLSKKGKRTLVYSAIIGGCAVLALTFFSISQYEKAKYGASKMTKSSVRGHINSGMFDSVKLIIDDVQSGVDHSEDLGKIGLKNEDFKNLNSAVESDLDIGLIKIHKPIDKIDGENAYDERYAIASKFFGEVLGEQIADKDGEPNWWIEVFEDFTDIHNANSTAYYATSVPAYTFSMATLVSFGLVLKHAEKTKEKEEKEV